VTETAAVAAGDVAPRPIVTIRSAELTVTVDELGARIASIVHRKGATEFLLETPWADKRWDPVQPDDGSSREWHRRYPGGWHTLVPSAGDERTVDGVEHPFHGEASWRSWNLVRSSIASCTYEVEFRTAPLRIRRTVSVVGETVHVAQAVTNRSELPCTLSWTEQPALGSAVVGPRSQVLVAGQDVGVEFPQGEAGVSAFRTFEAVARGEAEIREPDTGAFARLRWDAALLPYLHVWQEHNATDGFPWWRAVSTIALEPASRPYRSDDQESLGPIVLEAGREVRADFVLTVGFVGE
jgi:galactose mutarotase-like enzyme